MSRKSTLSDCDRLAQDSLKTAHKILAIQKEGIRESTALDKLYAQAQITSVQILQSMVNDAGAITRPIEYAGGTYSAELVDYCLRNFAGMGLQEKSGPALWEALPLVQHFVSIVKRMKGTSLDTRRGGAGIEQGLIAGEALFGKDRTFRYLGVPVQGYRGSQGPDLKEHWRSIFSQPEEQEAIIANADIFLPRELAGEKFIERQSSKTGARWSVDYSSERYIPGPAPKAYTLTIGRLTLNVLTKVIPIRLPKPQGMRYVQ